MSQQLYWLEAILKSSAGLLLIVAPVTTAKLLGLPHGNVGFWPRLLGITLIGIAAAMPSRKASVDLLKESLSNAVERGSITPP